MKLHMVFDITTGQAKARGRSGRWYTQHEIDLANRRGDPEGEVFRADLDRTDMNDADMRQMLLDEMHDCPDCRAALARGETPTFATGAELMAMARKPTQQKPKPLRWREQKRRRG